MLSNFLPSSTSNRLLFGLLLLGALCSRVYKLDTYGLFIDEKFTLLTSVGVCVGGANQQEVFFEKPYFTPAEFWKDKSYADFEEAIARAEIGAHLPYNFVLYAWRQVFGSSDWSMRFLSVLFGLGMLVMIYGLLFNLFRSEGLALLGMGLAVCEPLFLALNHTVRSYSMSLFLCVWSTYLFFKLLNDRESWGRYLLYVFITSIALLTHFLNGMVLLIQGIYVLFYLRPIQRWWRIGIAAGIASLVLLAWLTVGGGQWTFQFLADKSALMRKILEASPEENPLGESLSKATWPQVYRQFMVVFSDSFVTTNRLFYTLVGFKNTLLAIGLAIGTWGVMTYGASLRYRQLILLGVHGVAFWLYSRTPVAFMILEVNVFVLLWGLSRWKTYTSYEKRGLVFLSCHVVLPLIYLVWDAFQIGHTGNITQRYGAYALPFVGGWIAFLIWQIRSLPTATVAVIVGILLCQGYYVAQVHTDIYRDVSGKYSYFEQPRIQNPHAAVAQQIIDRYQLGDTVVYPSFGGHVYADFVEKPTTLIIDDAQYINAYLPKEARYWQRIDPTEPNRVLLRHANGQSEVLFDFEGRKFRY